MSVPRTDTQTLIANKWDIIVIMLGTNDANPDAWPVARGCGTVATPTTANCQYADDFVAMISEVRQLPEHIYYFGPFYEFLSYE